MTNKVDQLVKEVFLELSDALETGTIGPRVKVGLTINGSEHGTDVMLEAAKICQKEDLFDVVLIGEKVDTTFELVEACGEVETHQKMEEMLESGQIDACVTLHYNFPIGVSTVGKVVTPAQGREMLLATTTGTTSVDRQEAMLLNAINGIIAAKSQGIEKPTVGILNVEGARKVEKALRDLQAKGYSFDFAESKRADGGAVMRGNDLLMGSCDVMVCDSLTGNLLMKMLSAYQTGGNYEALGSGYGPGIGKNFNHKIFIISRASGAPVIANALKYAYLAVNNDLTEISKNEYKAAEKAGLKALCESLQSKVKEEAAVKMPDKEVVTEQIGGIDVTELDDAVNKLAKEGIYAESGMGCTGPIVLVNEKNLSKALEILGM